MNLTILASLSAIGLFVGMLLLMELGRRIGYARMARDPEGAQQGLSAVEGAVFALLGLLIAFTFSGAASRFEDRRHLIGQEANAIGTAYLRIDLLPKNTQPELRDLFRRYLDLRTVTYRNAENTADTNNKLNQAATLQSEIWDKAILASLRPEAPTQAAMLLLPALNDMIDITTTRTVATQNHPPRTIYLLLCGLSLVGALLAGYGMSCSRGRSLLHVAAFASIISLTVYVILDLEYPRLGFIRIDAADQVLIDLRKSMK